MNAMNRLFSGRLGALTAMLVGLAGCMGAGESEADGDVSLEDEAATTAAVTTPMTIISGVAVDMDNGAGLAGLAVRGCRKSDPACESPVDRAVSNTAGSFRLVVPSGTATVGWEGYFDFTGGDRMPALYYPNVVMTGSAFTFRAPLLSRALFTTTAEHLGIALDRTRGHLLMGRDGCTTCAGVSITVTGGAGSINWYSVNGAPSRYVTATTRDGMAGAMNVPVGQRYVTATLAGTGIVLAQKWLTFRAGSVTLISFSFAH